MNFLNDWRQMSGSFLAQVMESVMDQVANDFATDGLLRLREQADFANMLLMGVEMG